MKSPNIKALVAKKKSIKIVHKTSKSVTALLVVLLSLVAPVFSHTHLKQTTLS